MAVEVLAPGHIRVTIQPEPEEILEAAELVLRVHGWSKAPDSGSAYTLHEAINKVVEDITGSNKGGGIARPYRDEANELLIAKTGRNDVGINDTATSVDDVYAAITKAVQ